MAIALTPFSGFCGFMPLNQIADNVENVPEFAAVVGDAGSAFVKAVKSASRDSLASSAKERPKPLAEALKSLFSALMEADEAKSVKPNVRKLVQRYQKETGKSQSSELKSGSIEELVVRLNEQFPDDIGIFCAYLLNVVTLQPGEACFLQANEPHAYLQGDIIECMATSDNVVRAGLTPKLRDVPTLTSMLTYTWDGPDAQRMEPKAFQSCQNTKLYDPPIDEFSVALIDTKTAGEERHPPIDGPSIVIVTSLDGQGSLEADGKSLKLHRPGQVFFVGAGTEATFKGKLVAYRAYVTVSPSGRL